MRTYYYKDYNGWEGRTEFDAGFDNKVIRILSSKRMDGKLRTLVTVSTRDGDFLNHVLFKDLSINVDESNAKKVTEKAVKELHERVLATKLDAIIVAVKTFYATK